MLEHGFPPVYDANSRILILGSFPSVKSREQQFYYGHPRNRFWPLLAALLEEELPRTIEEKKSLLKTHHIALYDALERAEIKGSMDADIKDFEAADLSGIIKNSKIGKIYCNGRKSFEIVTRHMGLEAVLLPSTSPANAAWSFERLLETWSVILLDGGMGERLD